MMRTVTTSPQSATRNAGERPTRRLSRNAGTPSRRATTTCRCWCRHANRTVRNSFKMSKATVLQKSIDYITFLLQQKKKHEEELNALRKEVVALQIMKANYEQIVLVHQSQPGQNNNQISDEVKFQVFQAIGDSLFTSFNSSISVANFAELSGGVFSWLEEYCKPQTLKDMVLQILSQLNQTFGSRHS
ncbi:transcription factor, putative [Ixodes scapularis]|uniref:Transcription factor, putative n=1 Tax=Ixodes scapularis TaxID=6945 RepID=B7P2Y2_IXOSC|nr:transcription factor, putative [Ixodes scapularis]|eukprot:XP_002403132.1 transcription factor, putative [Ixodes scapularis]